MSCRGWDPLRRDTEFPDLVLFDLPKRTSLSISCFVYCKANASSSMTSARLSLLSAMSTLVLEQSLMSNKRSTSNGGGDEAVEVPLDEIFAQCMRLLAWLKA